MKYDVFISYSSIVYTEALFVYNTLTKNELACWMAPNSIPGGSNYTKEIPNAITSSEVFVLVLSSEAQNSIWVSAELETAFKKSKTIIPFAIDNCLLNDDFDFLLSRSQRINAYNRKAAAMEELVQRVKKIISQEENLNEDKSASEKSVQEIEDSYSSVGEITLNQLLNVNDTNEIDIEEWRNKEKCNKSLSVPIGVTEENSIFYLDIHYLADGPIGLFTGPNLTGKSEFVDNILLLLALRYSSRDLVFSIIDTQESGTIRHIDYLPHARDILHKPSYNDLVNWIGKLKEEINRRKELLKSSGLKTVSEINYKENGCQQTIPSLIIVIDEIKDIKLEYPNIFRELLELLKVQSCRKLDLYCIFTTNNFLGLVDESLYRLCSFRMCTYEQIPGRVLFNSNIRDEIQEVQLVFSELLNARSTKNIEKYESIFDLHSQKFDLIKKIREYECITEQET